ncbi:MAG: efflux RND transporter permease subunit [Tepidanaerobacteraceae bacterium]
MNLPKFSIKRPVTMLMIIAIALVLGFISFSRLGIDLFPNFVYPGAVVMTDYSGASPEEVESIVTKPIESILATVNNVKRIQSFSTEGSSTVVVEFDWGTNMDIASLDMREKVDLLKPYLPDDIGQPMVIKFDPSMMPIMQVAIYGGNDVTQLKRIADDFIVNRLKRLEGVATVDTVGGKERQINIVVDPDKLAFYGLSMSQISNKLMMENLNLPGGSVKQGGMEYVIRTTAEFKDIKEIEELGIPLQTGGIVPLKNIARIEDGHKDISTVSRYNEEPSIALIIQKQSNYNTVQVIDRIKKELSIIEDEIPAQIFYKPVMDQADFIKKAVGNVGNDAVIGGLLAMLIIYLFLRNVRSTLVIALSIPISIIVTFILIYFNKLTLNIMSLGGLALGVGMLVDNSIVVLENIFRHRQEGEDPVLAAVSGTNEVSAAVTASTLTTVAVFLPIVFIQGITAQFFKELALTVTFSLLSSLIVALSVVPFFSSRFVTQPLSDIGVKAVKFNKDSQNGNDSGEKKFNILSAPLNVFGRFYSRLEKRYSNVLKWSLEHRKIVVIASVGLFILSLVLIPFVGLEFLPRSDAGTINISIETPEGTHLEETDRFAFIIEEKLKGIPEIDGVLTSVGSSVTAMSMGGGKNTASIVANLVPLSERNRSSELVAEEIRQFAEDIPGAEIRVSENSSMDFGSMLKPISVSIKGDDFDILRSISNEVMQIVKSVEGTREVENSMDEGSLELVIKVDRDKATLYGLSSAMVAQTVRSAVSGSIATKYKVAGSEIDVMIKADETLIGNVEQLKSLLIPSPTGALITLGDVAEINRAIGPATINRDDQTRVVTISGAVVGRPAGQVNSEIEQRLNEIYLPEGYNIEFGGEQEQMTDAFEDLSLAFVLAIALVYMVMAAQFESLSQPLVIIFTVPLAIIGVIAALLISGRSLSMPAFIGVIMLAGIVVNNAIILIDFVNQLRSRGIDRKEAIIEAGPLRLRPILMTTLTTVLGLLPMALGLGEGGELRAPMATVVIGGLVFSTVLTLVVIPVIYTLFEDLGKIFKRIRRRRRSHVT